MTFVDSRDACQQVNRLPYWRWRKLNERKEWKDLSRERKRERGSCTLHGWKYTKCHCMFWHIIVLYQRHLKKTLIRAISWHHCEFIVEMLPTTLWMLERTWKKKTKETSCINLSHQWGDHGWYLQSITTEHGKEQCRGYNLIMLTIGSTNSDKYLPEIHLILKLSKARTELLCTEQVTRNYSKIEACIYESGSWLLSLLLWHLRIMRRKNKKIKLLCEKIASGSH